MAGGRAFQVLAAARAVARSALLCRVGVRGSPSSTVTNWACAAARPSRPSRADPAPPPYDSGDPRHPLTMPGQHSEISAAPARPTAERCSTTKNSAAVSSAAGSSGSDVISSAGSADRAMALGPGSAGTGVLLGSGSVGAGVALGSGSAGRALAVGSVSLETSSTALETGSAIARGPSSAGSALPGWMAAGTRVGRVLVEFATTARAAVVAGLFAFVVTLTWPRAFRAAVRGRGMRFRRHRSVRCGLDRARPRHRALHGGNGSGRGADPTHATGLVRQSTIGVRRRRRRLGRAPLGVQGPAHRLRHGVGRGETPGPAAPPHQARSVASPK